MTMNEDNDKNFGGQSGGLVGDQPAEEANEPSPQDLIDRLVEEQKKRNRVERQNSGSDEVAISPEAPVAIKVQKAQLDSFLATSDQSSNTIKLDLLMNLPLNVAIELGRTQMLIKDILTLGIGSIIELNKVAGEPVDLLVNNKKFAEGEVVVIDENFGIRITNLIKSKSDMEMVNETIAIKK